MVKLRSIKVAGIFFIVGTVLSIFSCCFPTKYILITDFIFYGAELINPNETLNEKKEFRRVDDTLRGNLFLEIVARGNHHYSTYLKKNISFITQSYATSVNEVLGNYLLLDELELKLDSDIYFESEIIEKGTDLWNHPKLKDYKWNYQRINEPVFYGYIGFIESFYEKAQIPQKEYSIEITCKTSDNLIITKSIKLYFEI